MRIVVDYDRCESNGLCMGILPEVFEVRDDDFMYVLDEHPPEEYRAKVEQAVNACPTQAISVVEDDGEPAGGDKAGGSTTSSKTGGKPVPDPVYASGAVPGQAGGEVAQPPAGQETAEPGSA